MVLLQKLEKLAEGCKGLVLVLTLTVAWLAITLGLYMIVTPALHEQCGPTTTIGQAEKNWETLDSIMRFYTEEEAFNTIKACTDVGRQIYFWSALFDMVVYAVLIAVVPAMGMLFAFRVFFGPGSRARWLLVLPLLGLLADWSENICIMAMIIITPARNPILGSYLGVVSPTKWFVDILAWTVALVAVIWAAIRYRRAMLSADAAPAET